MLRKTIGYITAIAGILVILFGFTAPAIVPVIGCTLLLTGALFYCSDRSEIEKKLDILIQQNKTMQSLRTTEDLQHNSQSTISQVIEA
jgi:hypothetical protein